MKRRKRMTGKSGRFGAPDRFALKSGQPLCNFLRVKKSAVRQEDGAKTDRLKAGGENMLLAFIVCLGIAAIILLAFALCRVSAHADRAASRHERERNQPS